MVNESFFPNMITSLPEPDILVAGLHAYLFQGETQQIVFMSFDEDAEIPEHSHEAQWGVILDGEIMLNVGGITRVHRKGDTYFIPRGVKHSAFITKGYKDLTLFNQKDRYRSKGKPASGPK